MRRERAGVAGNQVHDERDERQRNANGERRPRSRPARRGGLLGGDVFEEPRLELETRALVVLARERAGGEVRIEAAQLVAIDRNVRLAAREPRSAAPRDERSQHDQKHRRRSHGRDEPEERHSRSFAARSRSALVSCGAGTRRRRRIRARR